MLRSSKALLVSSVLLTALGVSAFAGCAPESATEDGPLSGSGGLVGAGGVVGGGGVVGAGGDVGVGGTGAGIGGTTGVGGVVGGGGDTATGGGSGTADCSTLPVCDDFETGTSGSAPAGWTVLAEGGTVVLDNAQAHSGSMSVRVKDGKAFLVNTDVLPAPGGKVYVRSYMRWNEAVPTSHTSYISIGASPTESSQELRFGGQEKVLHFNASEGGDGLAPDPYEYPSCATCVTPPVGQWVCVEIMFDYQNEVATAWIDDGVALKEFTLDDPSDFHSSGTWPTSVAALKIGYWAIGGAQQTLWYDDIKVGYERIGCN